jgi:uncharacterized Zn-finger protein
MPLSCRWEACQQLAFTTQFMLVVHQNEHIKELCEIARSQNTFGCQWPSCRTQKSGKSFAALTTLKKHLKTHLVKSLWCEHVTCDYDKPFSRQSDLDRHVKTKHARCNVYCCPIESCDYNTFGFPRKDKLMDHARKKHGVFRCPFDHCTAKVLEIEKSDHLMDTHGIGQAISTVFECSLAGCESTTSKFTREAAREHLRANHGMRHSAIQDTLKYQTFENLRHFHNSCTVCTRMGDTATVQARTQGDSFP